MPPAALAEGEQHVASVEVGKATLTVEAGDAVSGAVLIRAVDEQLVKDYAPGFRNSASNVSDFEVLFRDWAGVSAQGLATLQER